MKSTFVIESKKVIAHQEGDVWEESGKTWTIKNGIKRTVSKFEGVRKEFLTPLCCPSCNKSMKHYLDEQMWGIYQTCFNCVIDLEHRIMKSGKWEEYQKRKLEANADHYIKELKQFLDSYVNEETNNDNVTEDGVIEKWNNIGTYVKAEANKQLEAETNKIENWKNKL